jgi:hypothetical protein
MKIEYKMEEKNKPVLKLVYEDGQYEKLKEVFEELGLSKAHTTNGFGRGVELDFWKDRAGEFRSEALDGDEKVSDVYVIDDINATAIVTKQYVNLAVLRVVPKDNEVIIPLPKILYVDDINNFVTLLVKVLSKVLNVAKETSVKISFQ